MKRRNRNLLLTSASLALLSGTTAVGMAAHALSKQKQPFVSLPWFMGKYEREERIDAINSLIEKAKTTRTIKREFRDYSETLPEGSKTVYVCLGDDAPYGVNLSGEDGYPKLVAKGTGTYEFHNLGCRTFGSNEVRRLIDVNYRVPDKFLGIHSIIYNNDIDTEAIREMIEKADLITLDFGHVDFCYYFFYRVLDRLGIPVNSLPELRVIFEKGRNTKPFRRVRKLKREFDTISDILEEDNPGIMNYLKAGTHISVASLLSLLMASRIIRISFYSLIEISENFIANEIIILREIEKLNRKGRIIVLGAYNPFRNVKLKEDLNLYIGRLLTPLYSALNLLIRAETAGHCTFISQTLYPVDTPEWSIESASKNPVGWAVEKVGMRQKRNPLFPSFEGHRKTAETILRKLK